MCCFQIAQDQSVTDVSDCYRVLQSVTECYSMLQRVTACYSVSQSISSASTCTIFGLVFGPIGF